jgi:transcriptional regulator
MTGLSGSDIARELGITRQTVSATTKRALGKMFYVVQEMKLADDAFEAMLVLMSMCNVADGSMEDVFGFLSLFPKDIREQVQKACPKKSKFL